MSQAYFNKQAGTWDEIAAEKDTAKLEQMVTRFKLKPGSTILDVGTGTGILMPFLVQAIGTTGHVIGLDYAELMLHQAIAKSIRQSIADKVTFLLADVNKLPVASNSFDAIVCYSSFPHFPDKQFVLTEIYRALKRHGRLFICHTTGRQHINRIHQEIPLFVHDLLPGKKEMEGLLVSTGFQNIMIEDNEDSYLAVAEKLNL